MTDQAQSGEIDTSASARLPLDGVRVVEFSHMVMGPTCGMILGDLGAEVIKVEPPEGDRTRKLLGLGVGFFRTFNRNKKSVVIDVDTPEGLEDALALIATADIVVENFRPGRMAALGLDYASLSARFPRLIYVSHKGFLPGPYENRTALDEVVQMMAGLAYMTGPPGRPLRAGASVNDIMGGMFGALGAVAALMQRRDSGRGQEIQSALFENCAFLCAQHVQHHLMSGEIPPPMPARLSPWSVYDVFELAEGEQLFVGAVSDRQWSKLCEVIGRADLAADENLKTNAQRVGARPRLLGELARTFKECRIADISAKLEAAGLPYAPITRPDQLVTDPQLVAGGGLAKMQTDDGGETDVLLLPLTMAGRRLGVRHKLPKIGEQTDEVLGPLRKKS